MHSVNSNINTAKPLITISQSTNIFTDLTPKKIKHIAKSIYVFYSTGIDDITSDELRQSVLQAVAYSNYITVNC